MKPPAPCYSFGPFVVDRERGVLFEAGAPVVLTPRAFELLAALVEHRGELLHKDVLIREVWGSTAVEENNLARQISTLRKALRERPDQHDYIVTVPGVGYRFVAAVTECAAPTPARREPLASDVPTLAAPQLRRAHIGLFGAVALIAIVAAVLGTRYFWSGARTADAQRSLQQFTFGSGVHEGPAWSPDGKSLAIVSDRDGNADIWIQPVAADPVRLTTSPAREWQPDWSPDGQSIVFRSEQDGGGLFIASVAGGAPRRIADFGDRPTWSPAGDLILFSNATVRTGARKLYVVDIRGGSPREVAAGAIEPFISSDWLAAVEASWHPDGRRISLWGRIGTAWAFVTAPVGEGRATTSKIPKSASRMIDESRVRLGRFVWARSRKFLYFEGQTGDVRNIWRVPVNSSTLAWAGAPERLTTDVGDETDIALSPDGAQLAFTVRSQRTSVWSLDFDPRSGRLAGDGIAMTAGSIGQVDVDTLPDGSRLAYRAVRAGRSEVREFKTANREERVLFISNEWSPSVPRWSSDGRHLAFARPSNTSSSERRSVIAVVSPDERQERLLSLPGEATLRPSDWSTDGTTILGDCRTAPGMPMGICSIDAPGDDDGSRSLRSLVHDTGRHLFGPRFSPDQRWISFVAVDTKGSTTSQLFVAPVSGGPWIPITDGRSFDDKPRWSPDGRAIYFVSNRSGYLNLNGRRFDPLAGVPARDVFPVTEFDSSRRGLPSNIAQIEFAVASRRLFLPLTETQADVWVLDQVDR